MSAFNTTPIGWCDFTFNPLTGCRHGCPYCYARAFALRNMGRYKETGFEPTVHLDRFEQEPPPKPSRIFGCSMGDFAGPWRWRKYRNGGIYGDEWELDPHTVQKMLWHYIETYPQHQFILLTKNPAGLRRPVIYSGPRGANHYGDLPKNLVWGISITGDDKESVERLRVFSEVRRPEEKVVISYEPALSPLPELPAVEPGMGWLIIGAQTGPGAEVVSVDLIISAMVKAAVKNWAVWVKDNVIKQMPSDASWPREQLPLPGEEE